VPYPNEHACRVRSPGDFQGDSFRRISQGDLDIIVGQLEGQEATTAQAFRYPIEDWTEAEARAHCEEQGGRFEPAAPEEE
jgi:hypothetical protein